jgi:unsaturated rhamnogalacturonyl hydrolase
MTMSLASIVGMVEENFRQEVEEMIRFVFPAVLSQQTDTGMWRNVMTHPYSYLESSATAMFIYSFSIAIKAKAIDGDLFQKSIDRAWTALSEYVGEDGVFSGVAGPVWLRWQDGGYDNIEREAFYWGTGSFLLAAAEVIGGARA